MKFDNWQKMPHGPLDRDRLKTFEDSLGCALPDGFRRWLEVVNGGKPKNGCISVSAEFGFACLRHIYGFHGGADYCQLDRVNHILEGSLNSGLVAFGDDAGGNQFSISVRPQDLGAVKFWDHETTDEYCLADDFDCFLSSLRSVGEFITKGKLVEILENDDVAALNGWLIGKDINAKDEYDRAPIENAALNHSVNCIRFLQGRGAKPFASIGWLQKHLKRNPSSQKIIDLFEELFPADKDLHQ